MLREEEIEKIQECAEGGIIRIHLASPYHFLQRKEKRARAWAKIEKAEQTKGQRTSQGVLPGTSPTQLCESTGEISDITRENRLPDAELCAKASCIRASPQSSPIRIHLKERPHRYSVTGGTADEKSCSASAQKPGGHLRNSNPRSDGSPGSEDECGDSGADARTPSAVSGDQLSKPKCATPKPPKLCSKRLTTGATRRQMDGVHKVGNKFSGKSALGSATCTTPVTSARKSSGGDNHKNTKVCRKQDSGNDRHASQNRPPLAAFGTSDKPPQNSRVIVSKNHSVDSAGEQVANMQDTSSIKKRPLPSSGFSPTRRKSGAQQESSRKTEVRRAKGSELKLSAGTHTRSREAALISPVREELHVCRKDCQMLLWDEEPESAVFVILGANASSHVNGAKCRKKQVCIPAFASTAAEEVYAGGGSSYSFCGGELGRNTVDSLTRLQVNEEATSFLHGRHPVVVKQARMTHAARKTSNEASC